MELSTEALESKRSHLEELERTEREASRLEEALGQDRPTRSLSRSISANGGGAEDNQNKSGDDGDETENSSDYAAQQTVYTPPHPASGPPPRRNAPGMGLLNALSYTLHGMMDVDPETARRNGISKTRESISQVCQICYICSLFLLDACFSSKTRFT